MIQSCLSDSQARPLDPSTLDAITEGGPLDKDRQKAIGNGSI